MHTLKIFLCLFLAFSPFILITSDAQASQDQDKAVITQYNDLFDGIYYVQSSHIEVPGKADAQKGVAIAFNHHFMDDQAVDQPRYVVVDPDQAVPLKLMERPLKLKDTSGRSKLVLSLDLAGRAALEELTKNHIDDNVAIVINGEAITMHKVKEQITEGKIQITRCTDDACTYLYQALEDNQR